MPARRPDARRVVRAGTVPGVVLLFATTSQVPTEERPFLPPSQIERRRAGLDFPCFIIL